MQDFPATVRLLLPESAQVHASSAPCTDGEAFMALRVKESHTDTGRKHRDLHSKLQYPPACVDWKEAHARKKWTEVILPNMFPVKYAKPCTALSCELASSSSARPDRCLSGARRQSSFPDLPTADSFLGPSLEANNKLLRGMRPSRVHYLGMNITCSSLDGKDVKKGCSCGLGLGKQLLLCHALLLCATKAGSDRLHPERQTSALR